MPSTYTSRLRLELQATGENRSTWGVKANDVFSRVEEAVASATTVAMANANVTLSTNNGSADQARSAFLIFTGTNTAVRTVTIPTVSKQYIIQNATSGGFAINVSNGTSSVTVANGKWNFVWTDGTTVYLQDVPTEITNLVPTLLAGYTGKSTPVDADTLLGIDSADSNNPKNFTWANIKAAMYAAIGGLLGSTAGKTTPVDADAVLIADSAASNANKKLTWANIKATLKTYFDTLYQAVGNYASSAITISAGTGLTGGGDLTANRSLAVVYGTTANTAAQGNDSRITGAVQKATDTALTAGYWSTADNDGSKASGTYTPDPAGGNLKYATNDGAFTLAAPTATGDYTIIIQITNGASAGAITLSGFNKTGGDSFTTVSGDDFLVFVTKINGFTHATVVALQ